MRKKLDTRFPAARIKKIMQTDEEVGKIAQATPVLMSKALEMFLQDLCEKTYEVTLERGAKTLSAAHLGECVRNNGMYDFLKEVVLKAQNTGGDHQSDEENGAHERKSPEEEDACGPEISRKVPKLEQSQATNKRSRNKSVDLGTTFPSGKELAEDKKDRVELNSRPGPGKRKSMAEKAGVGTGSVATPASEMPSIPQNGALANTQVTTRLADSGPAEGKVFSVAVKPPEPRDFDLNLDLNEEASGLEEERPDDCKVEPGIHGAGGNGFDHALSLPHQNLTCRTACGEDDDYDYDEDDGG